MAKDQDFATYNACLRLMEEGDYKKAILLVESIEEDRFKAAVLIDAGHALQRVERIREGIKIYEELLRADTEEYTYHRPFFFYNAANGYHNLYALKQTRRKSLIPPDDEDLRMAKRYYRSSIELIDETRGSLASQILVNLGNCLSAVGRYAEAIESYEKALDAEPENGMAAGNLAIELLYAASLSGNHLHEYVALAHQLLVRIFTREMHLKYDYSSVHKEFQLALERTTLFMHAHNEQILPPSPVLSRLSEHADSEYLKFCTEKRLLLNLWVADQKSSPSLTDDIGFSPIITQIDDSNLVPELLKILDEIKESYSTARYLYFLSQHDSAELNRISEMTVFHSEEPYSIRGIYPGLCKTAYARGFDILDKVARLINIYFGVGEKLKSFWKLLATKQSRGEEHQVRFIVRPEISRIGNFGLYALADLCIDYFESEHVDFQAIDRRRNRITHDYLDVRLHAPTGTRGENNSIVELDDLSAETNRVLLLAKYALHYALSAIVIEERKKKTSIEIDKIYTRYYSDKPGLPFL